MKWRYIQNNWTLVTESNIEIAIIIGILSEDGKTAKFIIDFPTVYVAKQFGIHTAETLEEAKDWVAKQIKK